MFCNQCEQTAHGSGCVMSPGVCGKNDDVQSLQEMLLYGLKGMAAYANHARRLGKSDEAVSAFIEEALFATMTNVNFDVESLLEMVLECGRQNLRVMQLLDDGHIEKFGSPSPGPVKEGTQAGPGILMTGHDLLDLHHLLKQCEGTPSRSTRTARCCRRTCIRCCGTSESGRPLSAAPGRSRRPNSRSSRGRRWPPPTAF